MNQAKITKFRAHTVSSHDVNVGNYSLKNYFFPFTSVTSHGLILEGDQSESSQDDCSLL